MSNPEFPESDRFATEGEVKTALVDIDETICFYPGKRQYDLAEPDKDNVAKINNLYDKGWYIIYWTARGGSEKSRAAGKCYYDFTWKQLESWGCKFHDLSTGTKGKYIKPPYDLVVDDKAKRIEELEESGLDKTKFEVREIDNGPAGSCWENEGGSNLGSLPEEGCGGGHY